MKTAFVVGVILIVLGAVALAYQGITYTTKEEIVDIGPIEASKETEKTIPISPILGGAALVGGVLLVVYGARRS